MGPLLSVRGVTVRHGAAEAVVDASLAVPAGKITAIVGPNGAGKSSLLRAIAGAGRALAGTVELAGVSLDRLDSTGRTRAGLVLVPQGRQIFPRLTVAENLHVVADAVGLSNAEVEQALSRFPILAKRRALPAGVLSGGEQQMLALSRALMCHPKVLLLDEPTLGLAPIIVNEVSRVMAELAADGLALLVAEPSIRLIRNRIDGGYVMIRGKIVAEATGAAALEEVYLARMGMKRVEAQG